MPRLQITFLFFSKAELFTQSHCWNMFDATSRRAKFIQTYSDPFWQSYIEEARF